MRRNIHSLFYVAALCSGTTFISPAVLSSQSRGTVTHGSCPYSCLSTGVPKHACRDWRVGDTCYVEDMRVPVPLSRAPAVPPATEAVIVDDESALHPAVPMQPADSRVVPLSAEIAERNRQECRSADASALVRPRVEVIDVRRVGNLFDQRYEVRGAIEGSCISEAGYFEEGRQEQPITIQTARDFRRFEFSLVTRADERPEIRAYNINGENDIVGFSPEELREAANRADSGHGLEVVAKKHF